MYQGTIYFLFCEAQARVRQGSARDGIQGERPQSLNPSLELTLKLVATHHHQKFNFTQLMATLCPGEVVRGKGRCVGSLWVTLGSLQVTLGSLQVTLGQLQVTLGHLRATIGHLRSQVNYRLPLGHCSSHQGNIRSPQGNYRLFFSELHPKVRQTC